MEKLARIEISTLIGLMVRHEIDFSLPDPHDLSDYVKKTDQLMLELHESMTASSFNVGEWRGLADEGRTPFETGEAFREPIFYSGDSAYVFQYRDLLPKKYGADDEWLQRSKGFRIEEAKVVLVAVVEHQSRSIPAHMGVMRSQHPSAWTFLPGFTFSLQDISGLSGLPSETVAAVLASFTLPAESRNEGFQDLHDFNATTAFPIVLDADGNYVLLQYYSLVESLYESPFFWMNDDKSYRATASKNRGKYLESVSTDYLSRVFGATHVHANVDVYESKGKRTSEVDVLVTFDDRAIVIQAKSKRLTMEAKRGNDSYLKDDFKKSVQDAYDQARLCALALNDSSYQFVDARGTHLAITGGFSEIYILCLVSDNYPALSFQARQFLKHEETAEIKTPLVLDVFALDAMTEMLRSPLRFLSYLNRRAAIGDQLLASQELVALSYHLRKNLWIDDNINLMSLDESIASDLDVAMAVRRDGVAGEATPQGILTAFAGTTLWNLIESIEARPDAGIMDLGFLLLTISGDAFKDTNRLIDFLLRKAKADGQPHDLTILFGKVGLTIHVSDLSLEDATRSLHDHCARRKYWSKADTWIGVCLSGADGSLRFGLTLKHPWSYDTKLEAAVADAPLPSETITDVLSKQRKAIKVGRNDPCPCGSQKKYKKCCLPMLE